MKTKQLLIGGTALQKLGSKRYTEDTDYLVSIENKPAFFHDKENNIDYCNASANKFFAEIWRLEQNNNGEFGLTDAKITKKYVSHGEYSEIKKIINSVRK